MPKHQKWVEQLSFSERIALAEEKTSDLIDVFLPVIAIHESNRVLVYSELLSSQIPRSYAAHTFNLLQLSQHYFELLRLGACWDSAEANALTIPTIAALVDHPEIRVLLCERTRAGWLAVPHDTDLGPDFADLIASSEREFADKQANSMARRLDNALKLQRLICGSDRMARLRNFRHRHIAHALKETREEQKVGPLRLPRFGEERKLLRSTIMIVENFSLAIRNADFAFQDSRQFSARCAAEFWRNCAFTIPRS